MPQGTRLVLPWWLRWLTIFDGFDVREILPQFRPVRGPDRAMYFDHIVTWRSGVSAVFGLILLAVIIIIHYMGLTCGPPQRAYTIVHAILVSLVLGVSLCRF